MMHRSVHLDFSTASRPGRSAARRGFSFVELLFAVIILGIGLIMIAAIFPVGLSQTKSNYDETQASAVSRGAFGALSQSAHRTDFDDVADDNAITNGDGMGTLAVPDYTLYPVQGDPNAMPLAKRTALSLTSLAQNNMINPGDPRYGWVGFFKRPFGKNYAQVNMVVVQRSEPFSSGANWTVGQAYVVGNRTIDAGVQYICTAANSASVANEPAAPGGVAYWEAALKARKVYFRIVSGQVRFVAPANSLEEQNLKALAPGAFFVVGSANHVPLVPEDESRWNGTAYRIGNVADATNLIYDFLPGNAFIPDAADPDGAGPLSQFLSMGYSNPADWQTQAYQATDSTGYIVGRDLIGMSTGPLNLTFDGPAMDVSYYTSFVSLK